MEFLTGGKGKDGLLLLAKPEISSESRVKAPLLPARILWETYSGISHESWVKAPLLPARILWEA